MKPRHKILLALIFFAALTPGAAAVSAWQGYDASTSIITQPADWLVLGAELALATGILTMIGFGVVLVRSRRWAMCFLAAILLTASLFASGFALLGNLFPWTFDNPTVGANGATQYRVSGLLTTGTAEALDAPPWLIRRQIVARDPSALAGLFSMCN